MLKWIIFSIAIFQLSLPAQALYRWVDSKGVVHYSDKVPPEEAKYGREVINEKGKTIKRVDGTRTREQLEEDRQKQKLKEEQARIKAEKSKQDRMLLLTYDSLNEIKVARDEKIATIENAIGLAKGTLDTQNKRLRDIQGKAADYERNSNTIPKHVHVELQQARDSIKHTESYIQRKRNEQEYIRLEFAGYIKRYKELRGE